MSALSLISKMGKVAGLIRPSTNVTAYGAVERDYEGGATDIVAFLQPRSANITDRAGGDRMGITFRAYIAGIEDVRADDIIIYPASGSNAYRYRVTGVIVRSTGHRMWASRASIDSPHYCESRNHGRRTPTAQPKCAPQESVQQ